MTLLQLRKKEKEEKQEIKIDEISIDKLPEEFLRLEYPNEWRYLQKVRRGNEYSIFKY